METKKELELVEVEYWTCNNTDHRHKTKDVAQRCIDKASTPKKAPKRWSKAALFSLLDKKLAGENMAKLAREMGMTSTNMHRLTYKADRIRQQEKRTGEDYIMPHDRGSKSFM